MRPRRGQLRPRVRLLCAGRPARPPGWRPFLPSFGSRRSGRRQQFCFVKNNNLWPCGDRCSNPGISTAPLLAGVVARFPPPPPCPPTAALFASAPSFLQDRLAAPATPQFGPLALLRVAGSSGVDRNEPGWGWGAGGTGEIPGRSICRHTRGQRSLAVPTVMSLGAVLPGSRRQLSTLLRSFHPRAPSPRSLSRLPSP